MVTRTSSCTFKRTFFNRARLPLLLPLHLLLYIPLRFPSHYPSLDVPSATFFLFSPSSPSSSSLLHCNHASQLSSPRKAIVIIAIQNLQPASTTTVYYSSRLHLHLLSRSFLLKKPLHYCLPAYPSRSALCMTPSISSLYTSNLESESHSHLLVLLPSTLPIVIYTVDIANHSIHSSDLLINISP